MAPPAVVADNCSVHARLRYVLAWGSVPSTVRLSGPVRLGRFEGARDPRLPALGRRLFEGRVLRACLNNSVQEKRDVDDDDEAFALDGDDDAGADFSKNLTKARSKSRPKGKIP